MISISSCVLLLFTPFFREANGLTMGAVGGGALWVDMDDVPEEDAS